MAPARYRAPPADAILLHPLDDLIALYHRPSGRTHVVTAPVPELLATLADRALTVEELLAELTARFDLADADTVRLSARLEELEAAGLVMRA